MHDATRRNLGPEVRLGRGPLACEARLLADLDDCLEAAGDRALAQPILIVVPSRSLRLHLLDRIVVHRGGAAAGIQCLTLYAVAKDIASRTGLSAPPELDLLPILVRRFASQERSLRRSLGHLHDGYASVVGAVEDLLDAGFDPALEEALREALEEEGPARASYREVERARALVRIASRCHEAAIENGAARPSALMRLAAERVRSHPHAVRASTVIIYGFADATGVATDLIQALLESKSGILYLDSPPDPAWPERTDEGVSFGRRFVERLYLATGEPQSEPSPHPGGSVRMFRALGGRAEIRQIADRIRRLLDEGVEPERIGVVARQLDPYVSGLRTHFWRMGIPFSGVGVLGPRTEAGRRTQAVLDLLRQGRQAPLERWLDAGQNWSETARFNLRLAFYGLGAGRLEEAADLDLPADTLDGDLPLPVHGRLGDTEGGQDPSGPNLERRTIPRMEVIGARQLAHRLCQRFDAWQKTASLEPQIEQLRAFFLDDLKWTAGGALTTRLIQAAERLRERTRDDLPLSFDELVRWLEAAWSEIGRDSLGGEGGGVQILEVIEARGRTFEHLFLAGLHRGAFPRTVREDPLLPDSLRQVLGREGYGVLPDLARKLTGFAEERFLFAQLLASSPAVTLSWQEIDDEGHPLSVSPLVERMRWSESAVDHDEWRSPTTVQPLFSLTTDGEPDSSRAPRLAYEHAVNTAVRGARSALSGFLVAAFEEGNRAPLDWRSSDASGETPTISDAERLARARISILGEVDPIRGDRDGERTFRRLGPFFGFVGPAAEGHDLRSGRSLYVTALESLAACSWQTFLVRLLRLEALPDPLEILPGINAALVGDLVHRCLERLVAAQLPARADDLEAARSLAPHTVTWPSDLELELLLARQAEIVARQHGIGMRGFPGLLARVTRPYLDQARLLEWASGAGVPVAAVEVEGSLTLHREGSKGYDLRFKADRLDIVEEGESLVDYKTGRNEISTASSAATRRQNLIRRIRSGKSLQAVAYAAAARSRQARGRYLFLRPDLEGPRDAREIGVDKGNEEAQRAFQAATSTLIAAWEQGAFLPRLVEADRDRAPRRCSYCEVAEACLRHDSGARGRLRAWMAERLDTYIGGSDRAVGAAGAGIGVWLLGSKRLAELDEPGASGDGES